jgi:hypothetical protein
MNTVFEKWMNKRGYSLVDIPLNYFKEYIDSKYSIDNKKNRVGKKIIIKKIPKKYITQELINYIEKNPEYFLYISDFQDNLSLEYLENIINHHEKNLNWINAIKLMEMTKSLLNINSNNKIEMYIDKKIKSKNITVTQEMIDYVENYPEFFKCVAHFQDNLSLKYLEKIVTYGTNFNLIKIKYLIKMDKSIIKKVCVNKKKICTDKMIELKDNKIKFIDNTFIDLHDIFICLSDRPKKLEDYFYVMIDDLLSNIEYVIELSKFIIENVNKLLFYNTNNFIGCVFTNITFRKYFDNIKFYKFLGKDLIMRDYQYHINKENWINEKFSNSPCSGGGLYFAQESDIYLYGSYGPVKMKVEIVETYREFLISIEDKKLKSECIILRKI